MSSHHDEEEIEIRGRKTSGVGTKALKFLNATPKALRQTFKSKRMGDDFALHSSPSRQRRGLGSALFRDSAKNASGASSAFGSFMKSKSKDKRGSVGGNPIATLCPCESFVGDKTIISLLRPANPGQTIVAADVSFGLADSRSSVTRKFSLMLMELNLGELLFKDISDHKAKRRLYIRDLCSVKWEKSKSTLILQTLSALCNDHDENGHCTSHRSLLFIIKFKEISQSEEFARKILVEADNFATAIDIGFGMHEEKGGYIDENHIECLKRKRVDLYSISRLKNSAALKFAQEDLANYLSEGGFDDEASFWKNHSNADLTSADEKTGLITLQTENSNERKDLQELEKKLSKFFEEDFMLKRQQRGSCSYFKHKFSTLRLSSDANDTNDVSL